MPVVLNMKDVQHARRWPVDGAPATLRLGRIAVPALERVGGDACTRTSQSRSIQFKGAEMSSFEIAWAISFLLLLGFSALIGKWTKTSNLGILIDSRGRYSLTHFQLVLWTLVILSSLIAALIAALIATSIAQSLDFSKISISTQLLGLMGVSAGSAALATGVKSAKDAPGTKANVAAVGAFTSSTGAPRTITAKFSQIWLEEEGDLADQVVSVTKFQNFVFTLVIASVYIALALNKGGLPDDLPPNIVVLIGISQAGYIGGKIPDKS